MAKDKLTDYDSTASNNLDIGGISIAEGMLPSAVNNALREQMSHLADAFGAGTPLYVDTTNNRVGVNDATPSVALDVTGDVGVTGDLDVTGAVAVTGNVDVTGTIDVTDDGGGGQINNIFTNSGTAGNDNVTLRVKIGGTTARSVIQFADTDDTNAGQIDYDHDNDAMIFDVNALEAMRIQSDLNINVKSEGTAVTTSVQQGLSKVWANINQASGTTPDSFNVTSFTDVSAGRLTITIGNNMDSGAYVVTTSFYSTTGDSNVLKVDAAPAVGSYTLQGGEYQNGSTNVARDFQRAFSSVHGDLA